MANQYSLKEAAGIVGMSYSQIWHLYAYGKLQWPRRVGNVFILGDDDLAMLKTHIDNIHKEKDYVSDSDGRDLSAV